ncbi:MAG: hypothetical protein ACK5RL_10570 [Acidimicrobiales bacterium]
MDPGAADEEPIAHTRAASARQPPWCRIAGHSTTAWGMVPIPGQGHWWPVSAHWVGREIASTLTNPNFVSLAESSMCAAW